MAVSGSPDARPIRSFIAIEVEEPARAAIAAYLDGLRLRDAAVAWTRAENLHVTLKFLGGIAPARVSALAEGLGAIAAAQTAFAIAFTGVGAFPSAARARVLWVGADAPPLAPLASAVDGASVALAGVAAEERPYHPHVTLGRVRGAARARSTGAERPRSVVQETLATDRARDFGIAPARALVLFRSDTGPSGARHTALARLPLATVDTSSG